MSATSTGGGVGDGVGDTAGDNAGDTADDTGQAPGAFRRTLIRVMAMQVGALLMLWFLQSWFGR